MAKIQVIRQGESLPFTFDLGGEDVTGFTCTIEVKQIPADTALVSRAVPAVDNVFSGFLTQTETAAFAIGLYRIIAKLVNATTDQEVQIPVRFNVTTAWQ